MPLTRSFRETIKEQLANKDFRREFLRESVGNMVAGDLETAKAVLREYINGTIGFIKLGEALSKSPKSLMRMLSPEGNPQARKLFEMVAYIQKLDGPVLEREPTAKREGKYSGRKPSLTSARPAELRHVALGDSKGVLAREFGISRDTLYRYVPVKRRRTRKAC